MDRNLWVGMLFLVGVLIFGLIGVLRTLENWAIWGNLQADGLVTDATITNTRSTAPWSRSYYLTYQFTTGDEQRISVEEKVPGKLYREVDTGDEIAVRYMPEDPLTVVIEGNINALITFTVTTALWLLVGFGGGAIYLRFMRASARARKQLDELERSAFTASLPQRTDEETDNPEL